MSLPYRKRTKGIRITQMTKTCQFKGCAKKATIIAATRQEYYFHDKQEEVENLLLGCYCREHAVEIQCSSSPEYTTECPNCGCQMGVN